MPRHLALPLVTAALALCAGCWKQPPDLATFTPTPNPDTPHHQIVIFGDSLGRMAQDPAMTLFAARPDVSVSYNAQGGTETTDWADAYPSVDSDDNVVLELGTNDISTAAGLTTAIPNTRAALTELADARCVIMFTLNETGGQLRGAPFADRTRAYNEWLRATRATGEFPNLYLYDWNAQSARLGTGILNLPADNLHHNATGNDIFAQAIVDAALGCTLRP